MHQRFGVGRTTEGQDIRHTNLIPGDDDFLPIVVATVIDDAAAKTLDTCFVVANATESPNALRYEVVDTAFLLHHVSTAFEAFDGEALELRRKVRRYGGTWCGRMRG